MEPGGRSHRHGDNMQAICKKKLLVILGAGSSIPCGMPSVVEIDGMMKQWSREWKNLPEFPAGLTRGVFNDLWVIIEKYFRTSHTQHLGQRVSFERVLGEMTALASWVTPSPFGNPLGMAIKDPSLIDEFTLPRGRPGPYFNRLLILEQLEFLYEKLTDYMRERSRLLDTKSSDFSDYCNIFSRIRAEFEVGIYNLNYDDVAISACPDAFNGFTLGEFDARAVGMRREWNFVYHLHGSIHYSFVHSPAVRRLVWQSDLTASFVNILPFFPEMEGEFRPVLPTTLVAGGFKLDQLLADPAQSFHASLVRHIHEADAVLIAGYGFGDAHVNRALRNRFELKHLEPEGGPAVVVIEKSDPARGSIANQQRFDFRARGLTGSLKCNFDQNMRQLGNTMSAEYFIQNNELETDVMNRVAVWHGGFLEALGSVDEIIAWLLQ